MKGHVQTAHTSPKSSWLVLHPAPRAPGPHEQECVHRVEPHTAKWWPTLNNCSKGQPKESTTKVITHAMWYRWLWSHKVGVSFRRGINERYSSLTLNTLVTLYNYWREIANENEWLHLEVDMKTSNCWITAARAYIFPIIQAEGDLFLCRIWQYRQRWK